MRIVAAALLLSFAFPAQADVLIDNVNGVTLDAQGKVESFNGVLIGDDGRIEQVLHRSDKRPGKVDYRMDGKGRVLIPGLIDSHVRLMRLGLSLLMAKATGGGAENGAAGDGSLAQPRPEDRDLALAEAQSFLLARGVTAVADMGATIEDWQTYRRAGDLGRLHMRIVAYADGTRDMVLIGGPGPTPWLYGDRLRLNGVALALDGTLAAREAELKAPYADAPRSKGASRLTDTQLKNLMSRAAIDNFQVAIDAHGDAAAARVLDALDDLSETYTGDRRWRIEQAQAIDPADLPRFAQRGVAVSMQPRRLPENGAIIDARLGPERAAHAQPWRSLSDAGVVLAFGSGAPGDRPDPFAGMAAAITRQDANGQPFGGWQAQERLTRVEALAAYTTGAANALFAEGRFGRIAKGERADFVLIAADPMLATPAELRQMRVLQSWVGGTLVYDAERDQAEGP